MVPITVWKQHQSKQAQINRGTDQGRPVSLTADGLLVSLTGFDETLRLVCDVSKHNRN